MVRISPNTNPDPKSQEMLNAVKSKLGQTFNIFTTMAHSSAALGAYLGASGAMGTSQLSGALREQLALTVAGANACDYCASAHTVLGKMNGFTDEQVLEIRKGSASFDSKLDALVKFTASTVENRGRATEESKEAFLKQVTRKPI